jgi:exopolysaccharide biosynthesis operon protein EpsL
MAIAAAGLFLPATEASALWDDKLKLFAEEKITHDDNVFRFSRDLDPMGDTYHTTSLGFNLDAPLSRQRFQADYMWNATRFNRSTELDFDGHDARAIWLWQLGNDLSGRLGYAETLSLASFAYIQTRTPDPLKTRQASLKAAFLVTPRWRLQTGWSGLEQTNGNPALRISDINIVGTDVTLSYVTPANNSVGLSTRVEDGRFPNREFMPGSLLDNAYRQYGAGIVVDWTVNGVSRLTARGDHIRRLYKNLPQSDVDGNTFLAEYDWKPTGKFSLAATARRDISPYQDVQSSFVLVKGVSLRPKLDVSEKIDVSGIFDYSYLYFLGDPGLVSGGVQGRVDRVRSATATVSYRPARALTLLVSAQREARSSNVVSRPAAPPAPAVPRVDYVVNVFSISARITF